MENIPGTSKYLYPLHQRARTDADIEKEFWGDGEFVDVDTGKSEKLPPRCPLNNYTFRNGAMVCSSRLWIDTESITVENCRIFARPPLERKPGDTFCYVDLHPCRTMTFCSIRCYNIAFYTQVYQMKKEKELAIMALENMKRSGSENLAEPEPPRKRFKKI